MKIIKLPTIPHITFQDAKTATKLLRAIYDEPAKMANVVFLIRAMCWNSGKVVKAAFYTSNGLKRNKKKIKKQKPSEAPKVD